MYAANGWVRVQVRKTHQATNASDQAVRRTLVPSDGGASAWSCIGTNPSALAVSTLHKYLHMLNYFQFRHDEVRPETDVRCRAPAVKRTKIAAGDIQTPFF